MPYRADFRFVADAGSRTHRVRNFGQAIFYGLKDDGAASDDFWEQISSTSGHFWLTYPNKTRRAVQAIIERALRDHMLEAEVQVTFTKVPDHG